MKYGFIGYGNMGSAVVRALLKDGSMEQGEVIVHNRTVERLRPLVEQYPQVRVAASAREVAESSDVVFLCVRSGAVRVTLEDIAPSLPSSAHLVAINGGVEIGNLERTFTGAISKVIPSMTLETGRGVTLACHNRNVSDEQKASLHAMFARSSIVKEVSEDQLEVASDLTSCAPGLIAEMMDKFAAAGAELGRFSQEEALSMVLETMMGTAILLTDQRLAPQELKCQVATKGGITEQGLKVLDRELPRVYSEVFQATLSKHAEVKKAITADFDQAC